MSSNLVLGIETAIGGGSLALFDGEKVVGSLSGGLSRAEEILVGIDNVLRNTGRSLRDTRTIVVSRGPGSFTGIRVGLSTAMGVARALNAKCIGISLFEAIGGTHILETSAAVVIALGRGQFGVACFDSAGTSTGQPESFSDIEMTRYLEAQGPGRILVCGDLSCSSILSSSMKVEHASETLAEVLIRRAIRSSDDESLEPIYLAR